MPQYYDDEFKNNIVCLHLEEGRMIKSIVEEYGASKASKPPSANRLRIYERNATYKKRIGRSKKRKSILKKSGGILCEGNRLAGYQFIQKYYELFGV